MNEDDIQITITPISTTSEKQSVNERFLYTTMSFVAVVTIVVCLLVGIHIKKQWVKFKERREEQISKARDGYSGLGEIIEQRRQTNDFTYAEPNFGYMNQDEVDKPYQTLSTIEEKKETSYEMSSEPLCISKDTTT